MSHLLDTNAVIAFQKKEVGFLRFLSRLEPGKVNISSIILFELDFGAFKGDRTAITLERIDRLPFDSFDFMPEDARAAGEVRATLRARGTPIGPYDVLIAGQALARGLTLVTRNTREFARVDGLSVEDWEA